MDIAQTLVSVCGGGLAGGCVSVFSNRLFHWRALRTQFYPLVNEIHSIYLLRLQEPNGRSLVQTIGMLAKPHDDKFILQRAHFLSTLIKFNELKEAREVRSKLLRNMNPSFEPDGTEITSDLMPEYDAIAECLQFVHKKLHLK